MVSVRLPRALHDSERPSLTAQVVTFWRALELSRPPSQRIVTDPFAPFFLGRAWRVLLSQPTATRPVFGGAGNDVAALATFVLCRHRAMDEHLLGALDQVEQVLVLGAGFDARAHRFADQLARRPFFEVDLPPLSRRKAAIIAANPGVFSGEVVRVEVDFKRDRLHERLVAAGFAAGAATAVIWEGVVPYLDEPSVSATVEVLQRLCGAGSSLTCDLWDGTGGGGTLAPLRRLVIRSFGLIGEPLTFSSTPPEASALLAAHGFTVTDVADQAVLTERYATQRRRALSSLYVVAASAS